MVWNALFVAAIAATCSAAVWSSAAEQAPPPPPPGREAVQLVEKIAEAARTGLPSVAVPAARYIFSDLPLRVVGASNLVIDLEAGT